MGLVGLLVPVVENALGKSAGGVDGSWEIGVDGLGGEVLVQLVKDREDVADVDDLRV